MAAAVQGKKKGFGLDCNRGGTNKTAMKRYPPAAMKRYKDKDKLVPKLVMGSIKIQCFHTFCEPHLGTDD